MIDENMKEVVSYLVYESSQTRLDRIITKLVIALVVAVVLLFVSNGLWLWAWSQYDYTSENITQDGRGINIVGDGNEVQDGADSETP